MTVLLSNDSSVNEAALRAVAHMPTGSLSSLADPTWIRQLSDADFMRIAVELAQKSYDEGGCPIGAVIIDNETRQVLGKGHNTLVQDSDPYNHGETAAMRDAGRIDFSRTTLFTSLSPCDICTALLIGRGFQRVVVGNVTHASGNETVLRSRGVKVEILEDERGVALYGHYRAEKPELDLEDWQGVRALTPS
ncbi:MAG: nucleoside deaminase [Pseudomonadota bacterium]